MRRAFFAFGLSWLTLITIARAAEEERVTTRDGTIIQGELVEKSPGRKLVLKLASGEIRTIPWADILPASLAPAKETEVVHLKDGGAVQGKLVEIVPRDHWTLKLVTGEVRKIPWGDVEEERPPAPEPLLPTTLPPDDKRGRAQVTQGALPANTPTPAALTSTGTPLMQAHVTVTSDTFGVKLQGADSRLSVCEAPCDAVVVAGDYYRIIGPQTSSPFQLGVGSSTVDVRTSGGPTRLAGLSLIVAGLVGLAGGGGLLGGAYANPDRVIHHTPGSSTSTSTSTPQKGLLIGAIIAGAIGVVALAIGIPVFATTPAPGTRVNGERVSDP